MKAPPLPDTFGNYALGDFAEVVLPDAISWMPQTTGWLWLGGALILLLLHKGFNKARLWHADRYRREARRRLTQLEMQNSSSNWLSEINKLLKLAAMAAYSREEVAALWGNEWTSFLNEQCAKPPFTNEQKELLAQATYTLSDTVHSTLTQQALLDAALLWVEKHLRRPA